MQHAARAALAMSLLVLLAACKPQNQTAATPDAAPAGSSAPAAASDAIVREAEPRGGSFDIDSIPVSTVTLGDFPYITLPAGYTSEHRNKLSKDFARFPFWLNGQSHWVEGKFYGTSFAPAEGKGMSEYEVKKNFETLLQQMGGVKLSEGSIPSEVTEKWGDEITQGFIDGLGDVYNNPVTTYLVRRNDGNIWVHLVTDSAGGAYLVGQEQAFAQTAQLLPASALKQQLDSAGKVALQVNFATDKAEILPDSLPQIDQVVQLLKDDATLQLAINGHTDDTGEASHNQKLSEDRANAVLAVLVGKGIDGTRLSAKGFGQTQPVADNATAEGKAKNRRVELVKKT